MTGGLFDPLGTDRADLDRGGLRRRPAWSSAPAAVAALLLAGLAALLAVSFLRDTGDRGMPVAVAPIERVQPPPAPPPAPVAPAPASPTAPVPPPPAPPEVGGQDVQIENGVRVVRPRRAALPPAIAPAPPPVQPVQPVQGGLTLRPPDGRAAR